MAQDFIAMEQGEYKFFSGIIMWGGTEAKVKNASFRLRYSFSHRREDKRMIVWESGIWEDGVWRYGLWEDGVWNNGIWSNGTWNNGTWNNGIWSNGTWNNGVRK